MAEPDEDDELPPWLGERLRDLVAPRPRDDEPESELEPEEKQA